MRVFLINRRAAPLTTFLIAASMLPCIAVSARPASAADQDYTVHFSTLWGGSLVDQIRDLAADDAGNIYVTGGSASADLPTQPNESGFVFDSSHNGDWDVFVTKLDTSGALLWSTFIGGPGYDRAYAVDLAPDGSLYVAGRAGVDFPVTQSAMQTEFRGGRAHAGDPYGEQDGFVCRLDGDGHVSACTYFGSDDGGIIRDVHVGPAGDVYVTGSHVSGSYPDAIASVQRNAPLGGEDMFVAKLSADLTSVSWLRFLGGSDQELATASIGTDAVGNVYVAGTTYSAGIATPGSYDSTYGGQDDIFVSKLDETGGLLWTTYLGASGREGTETHELVVRPTGGCVVVAPTTSPAELFPSSVGTKIRHYGGDGGAQAFAASLSADGKRLLALTFIGGSGDDLPEGTALDPFGSVYFTGATTSADFPETSNGQAPDGEGRHVMAVKLDQSLDVVFATVFGGAQAQNTGRAVTSDARANFYFGGQMMSDAWPTVAALQEEPSGSTDGFVVKLDTPASCADPNGDHRPTASDSLFILGAAVGARACDPCLCDLDGSGAVRASDALAELRVSVGSPLTPACTACP